MAKLFAPFIKLISVSTDVCVRILGGDPSAGKESISGEELRGMVAAHEDLTSTERELIDEVFEAGLVLVGTEVKSLRLGRASLVDGFASIDGGEAYLHNIHIPEYEQGTWTNHEPKRKRKMLLNRDEIRKIGIAVSRQGYTLVPLSLYFKDGKVKALATTGKVRSTVLPDVPTLRELGVDMATGSWFGVFVPKATPPAIVNKLNDAIVKILDAPQINSRLVAQGAEPVPMNVDEFSRFVRHEYESWIPVVKASGARAE